MLKCKVNTREFQDAITKLDKIIDNKTRLNVLKGIKLTAENGRLELIASDLKNYVTAVVDDVGIESEGSVVIMNIKEIMKSFKFMKEWQTKIEIIKDEITITNGSRNIKMKCITAEEFPNSDKVGEVISRYTYNTKSLYNRIKKVDYAMSKDEIRPTLTGINFDGSDMVTLDGYRAAVNTDRELTVDKPFIVGSEAINFLIKTLNKKDEDTLEISTNDEFVIFEYDNLTIISRLIEGEFFKYKEIFPKDTDSFKIKTKKLKDNIEFLSIYTKGTDREITKATITGDKLELSVNNADKGIFSTTNDINSKLNITMGFNNKYMLDTLKVIKEDDIEIKIANAINPIIIQEDENSKYIVMPIRIEEAS